MPDWVHFSEPLSVIVFLIWGASKLKTIVDQHSGDIAHLEKKTDENSERISKIEGHLGI